MPPVDRKTQPAEVFYELATVMGPFTLEVSRQLHEFPAEPGRDYVVLRRYVVSGRAIISCDIVGVVGSSSRDRSGTHEFLNLRSFLQASGEVRLHPDLL